jgi:hypothetical protein
MELRHIRYFLAVAYRARGGVSKAFSLHCSHCENTLFRRSELIESRSRSYI